jgi:hypothetical protein
MLAGKLGRAGGAVISPLRKTRGRGGCRQVSTAGTCPFNILRNSSPNHERPPHPSAGASAGLRVADTAAASPSFGWPSRGARKAARARAARLAQKNFSLRAPPWPPRPSLPAGAVRGQFFWGADFLRKCGRPLRGQAWAIRVLVAGQGVPPRPVKDGDATVARRGFPWCCGAHAAGDIFGLRGLAALAEGLRPRPAGHP